MTATPVAAPDRVRAPRVRLEDVAVLATLAWWGTGLIWATGGREPHRLTVQLVLLTFAALVVRPWTKLPVSASVTAMVAGLAGFVVALVSPTGWDGAVNAANLVLGAQLALVVAAWARDVQRRALGVGVVVVIAGIEFMKGIQAWWAGGQPDRVFVGTFYWHNQAGIFLAVGGVLALGALALRLRGVELGAWIIFPLCVTGTKISTSRASQIGLALGVLAVAVLTVWDRRTRVAGSVRLIVALVGSFATYKLLTGPALFQVAGTGHVPAYRDQSIATNAGHRLDFWNDAWHVFLHWPVTGSGFYGFGQASVQVRPGQDAYSAYAHNGFLQLFSDGGLVLAVPVLAALAAGLFAAVRDVRASGLTDAPRLLALIALTVLLLHIGLDFDLVYPALVALTGVLLGLSAAPLPSQAAPARTTTVRLLPILTVALLALSAVVAWHGILHVNLPLGGAA